MIFDKFQRAELSNMKLKEKKGEDKKKYVKVIYAPCKAWKSCTRVWLSAHLPLADGSEQRLACIYWWDGRYLWLKKKILVIMKCHCKYDF